MFASPVFLHAAIIRQVLVILNMIIAIVADACEDPFLIRLAILPTFSQQPVSHPSPLCRYRCRFEGNYETETGGRH